MRRAKDRLELKATKRELDLIRMAARESHCGFADFVLESACARAQQLLAEKRIFVLNSRQWSRFIAALNRPVQQKPTLRKLLNEPSLLERTLT